MLAQARAHTRTQAHAYTARGGPSKHCISHTIRVPYLVLSNVRGSAPAPISLHAAHTTCTSSSGQRGPSPPQSTPMRRPAAESRCKKPLGVEFRLLVKRKPVQKGTGSMHVLAGFGSISPATVCLLAFRPAAALAPVQCPTRSRDPHARQAAASSASSSSSVPCPPSKHSSRLSQPDPPPDSHHTKGPRTACKPVPRHFCCQNQIRKHAALTSKRAITVCTRTACAHAPSPTFELVGHKPLLCFATGTIEQFNRHSSPRPPVILAQCVSSWAANTKPESPSFLFFIRYTA